MKSLFGPHVPKPRKFSGTETIDEAEFRRRYEQNFRDPYFEPFRTQIKEMAGVAWRAHQEGRKAPVTQKAGPGFADPNYELATEWLATREAIAKARRRQADPASPTRILVISASARNHTTCPSEVAKSRLLAENVTKLLERAGAETELLDLSLVVSQYGRTIHPCKACVSTAMPLCHWPCSCYPNHALGQVHDWMNEIYPMWVAAHGILILTPVYWYQSPSPLKLMLDRLVCADGGNPDQTSTHGKDAKKAKEIELKGWDFPKHLAGRVFSLVVHGDAAGADELRNALRNLLTDMHLLPAGLNGELTRYIGYYEPYARSHEALEKDRDLHTEVENVAKDLLRSARAARNGGLRVLEGEEREPRPK